MKPAHPLPQFNLAYQAQRHFAMHMHQWPNTDPKACMADVKRLLTTGQAWLWPEPRQMELFA